jgi:hypothetical protein
METITRTPLTHKDRLPELLAKIARDLIASHASMDDVLGAVEHAVMSAFELCGAIRTSDGLDCMQPPWHPIMDKHVHENVTWADSACELSASRKSTVREGVLDGVCMTTPPPVPVQGEPCDGCSGDGVFFAGRIENGKRVGRTGKCFRCGGKGWMSSEDMKRNRYYDNHVRKIPV